MEVDSRTVTKHDTMTFVGTTVTTINGSRSRASDCEGEQSELYHA
jgi:hypothetical protein